MSRPAEGIEPLSRGVGIELHRLHCGDPRSAHTRGDIAFQIKLVMALAATGEELPIVLSGSHKALAEARIDFIARLGNARADRGDNPAALCPQRFHRRNRRIGYAANGALPAGMGCPDHPGNAVRQQHRRAIGRDHAERAAGGNLNTIAVSQEMARAVNIVSVAPPVFSEDNRSVLLSAVLAVDPEDLAARNTVDWMRDQLPRTAAAGGATISVGGPTALIKDFDDRVAHTQPMVFAAVALIAFVMLLIAIRSVFLAFKGVLMTVLSVAAAYGSLVMIFQWGWLERLGFQPISSIDSTISGLVPQVTWGLIWVASSSTTASKCAPGSLCRVRQ